MTYIYSQTKTGLRCGLVEARIAQAFLRVALVSLLHKGSKGPPPCASGSERAQSSIDPSVRFQRRLDMPLATAASPLIPSYPPLLSSPPILPASPAPAGRQAMDPTLLLTLNLQLCLAHYCDIHGPTPLMVTEGLSAPCGVCHDGSAAASDGPPRSAPAAPESQPRVPSTAHAGGTRDLGVPQDAQPQRPALRRSPGADGAAVSGLDTPPESPRPLSQQPRRDSSYRRTYDETVTRKQGPCDNCAMTLPRRQQSSPEDVIDTRSPTLRTRAPAERVFLPVDPASPPNSQSSSDTDADHELPRQPRSRRNVSSVSSRTTSCSSTSTTSERHPSHVHYVDYTSTHEPILPDSFSLVRASCLRALSFETLPRAPSTATPTSSPQHHSSPSFVTTQSAGSAASGGAIFFGDSLAGYTTAYIFRIPDVHARGHKRVYAFLALSTHKERLAMKTFAGVSSAFRELATWIQTLAEAEAERTAESSPIGSVLHSGGPASHAASSSSSSTVDAPNVDRGGSSFLTGGSGFTRRMGGPGSVSSLKARGLAELVGQPDFFITLHKKFVQLLFEVGVSLNS
ncbi:folliculin [Trichoderma cornu-damae]|uniref:Folliculin n=1 Tax=Trichoderma cornu-damae TaxID=654480 RepID=A0A9P8QPD5_9HYPO|nr:folliculin [Trichoderma cornu-damae]